jgi:hypothetical protein
MTTNRFPQTHALTHSRAGAKAARALPTIFPVSVANEIACSGKPAGSDSDLKKSRSAFRLAEGNLRPPMPLKKPKLVPSLSAHRRCVLLSILALISSISTHAAILIETGFEGSSALPTGWSQSQISGSATWAIQTGGRTGGINPTTARTGTNNATLYIANTNENKTRLISPTFSTNGHINLSLTFWHTQQLWSPDQDELKVFYSSNGGSTWTELAHYTTSIASWTQRTLSLPTPSANSRIAFEGNARYGHGVCLDDIQVTGDLSSLPFISVSATDATATEAGQTTGTWTITRGNTTTDTTAVAYTLGGTATPGSDYTVSPASPVTFAAGETSKTVTLTPIDDTVGAEGVETATLTLTPNPAFTIGQASADISLIDDEGYDLNILIIGSTRSFSDGNEHDVVHQKAFNPATIATHLGSILSQDPLNSDSVNVVFEDVFKTKTNTVRTSSDGINDITAHCYSLAQHFMWPDGKAARLSNLRGEAGTKWDTIILCSDPYIMANFPGMYAEGVKLIQSEVAKSANPAQVILMAQWPENSSNFSADDFNEVVHRVGNSAGLAVVPAGKVWDTYTSQDTAATHPTPRGAYLAAASIFSKLYNRSASTSNYTFNPDGANIANHAHSQVQNIAANPQYSGVYTAINPFQMKYVGKRTVSFRETGTSTEDRLREALMRLDDVCRITFVTTATTNGKWDFNYGRGNDGWEDDKDYEVDPLKHDRAYGFPMHHYYTGTASNAAAQTMPYGIDKYYYGATYEDGTDLGIAYNMIRPNTREPSLPADVRCIPIRLIWLKMERAFPGFAPLGDNTHMGPHLNDASAAFMYTLLSGRCPVVEEPPSPGSTAWLQWLGHKTGYETAWQMSHLTTRSPGFRVLPSHVDANTVTSTAPETMTVQFMNPPQSDVTVNLSSSNPAFATVSPATLTFTPANYQTPQTITVTGVPANAGLQNFDVLISTTSNDEIYNGLNDSWPYTSNTTAVTYGQSVLLAGFDGTNTANTTSGNAGVFKQLTRPHKSSTSSANIDATFTTSDAVVNGLQWAGGMTSPATWGTATFIPNATTTNNVVFAADNAFTGSFFIQNTGTNEVTLEKLHFRFQRDNATGGSANQVTITLASGNLAASGPGVQALSSTTGAFNYDFNLSTILTDATLSPGQSATFTFTATPTDPAGTGRRIRVDNLAISGNITATATPFDTWATVKGLTGPPGSPTDPAKDADPDNDNRNNLAEFAFNGNPLDGSDNGKVFSFTQDSDFDPDASKELILTIAVRSGTPAFTGSPLSATHPSDGITYRIEGSMDLTNFTATVNAVPTPLANGLPPAGAGYEYRSFTLVGSNNLTDKGFLRAKVSSP